MYFLSLFVYPGYSVSNGYVWLLKQIVTSGQSLA